jgi:cardiolipin synthase A/B
LEAFLIDHGVEISAEPIHEGGSPWATLFFAFAPTLLFTGVRVFLYKNGYLRDETISIDSAICSIGSANIDIRSFSINYELSAVLYNERLARELEQAFERDLFHSTEFGAAEYEECKATLRFRDSVARLFSPLL